MAVERMVSASQDRLVGPPAQFLGNMEWVRSMSDAPVRAYAALCQETWSATKHRLQEHTEYLRKLSECKGPADMCACYGEFVKASVTNSFADGLHAFDRLQKHLSSVTPPE